MDGEVLEELEDRLKPGVQEDRLKPGVQEDRLKPRIQEQQVRLAAAGIVMSTGKFEVLAITAGEGNGWIFSEDVLLESLSLWNGVDCYVDHGGWFGERSVRDLGGVFRNPRWVEEDKGVRMDLVTMGPSGELISELGRQILADGEPKPKVGFSADVLFTAKGKEVQR